MSPYAIGEPPFADVKDTSVNAYVCEGGAIKKPDTLDEKMYVIIKSVCYSIIIY